MSQSPAVDAEYVNVRLIEAGAALAGLPPNSPRIGIKVCDYGFVSELTEAQRVIGEPGGRKVRFPAPNAVSITRMDETFAWLAAIPNVTTRRIVAARCLTTPVTGNPIYPWARLARMLGADVRAVQRWHEVGIKMIVSCLMATGYKP